MSSRSAISSPAGHPSPSQWTGRSASRLALLNILPIPALDGGHLLLLAIEAVIRREIPVRIKLGIQKVGFVLLLAFMIFVVYKDILNF